MVSKMMALVPEVPVIMLISGCVHYENQSVQYHASGMSIKSFTTDKETYGSEEDMKITIIIHSDAEIKNLTARVSGIKPYRTAFIDNSKTVDVVSGDNEIIFSEKTPYCTSGCGGVYPGPYNLNAEIFINGEMAANSTTTINLVGD